MSRQGGMAQASTGRGRLRRRRTVAIAGGLLLVLMIVVAAVVTSGDDDDKTDVATSGPSTTLTATSVTAPSAAPGGKPCVAVADPLPAGAPAVDVKVGPPPTQLVSQDIEVGTGAPVAADTTVTVHYIGVACSTGKIFDSSYSRNQPASFPLNGVIKGWQEGIPGMNVGGQRLLGIPPGLAYGAQGRPPTIGPNEALWFVVEVLEAKPT